MPKENQQTQTKKQQKPKPAPAKQQIGAETGVLDLAPNSLDVATAPGAAKQAGRLANSRLSVIQRQRMAASLGQMQGNGHMQEVMAFVRQQQATQQDAPASNGADVVQRREAVAEDDKPSEAEKAAALASAKAAEQKAAQSAAQGQNQFNKAKAEKETKQQEGETAKQQVPAGDVAAEPQAKAGGSAAAAAVGVKEASGASAAGAEVAIDANGSGAAEQAASAGPTAKAPASAAEDPGFQSTVANIKGAATNSKTHAPAKSKAGEAQDAAESPASEIEGKAQANQVGEMAQAETPAFDAAAFKAQLMDRIAALSPKTAAQADEFKESNKLGGLKDEMQGKVSQERDAARGPLEEKAAAAPDTGAVEPKPVTPLAAANPGAAPADPGAKAAAPKQKGSGEVEQPIQQNAKQVEEQMAAEDVTDEQLANSNEPSFQGALSAKTEAKAQAATAPQEYRQFEQERIAGAEAEAAATAQAKTQAMHGDRAALLTQVDGQQNQTKSKDEQARAQVAARIQTLYGKTKANVEKILNGLDAEVSQAFDAGAATAKQVFEEYVDAKMEAFKEERYGGWFGWAKWAKDKLLGMPSEVNAFYAEGRQRYLKEMDAVIDKVVTTIGSGLTKAKAEIAAGKQEIQEYVASLPQELQEVGQQASQDIQSKFDELESSVDSKQSELIDTLASKYQENLQAVDARIDELKAANQGLVNKALNAVVGVIQTIIKLKNMLMSVLARVADVVGKIIKDPIGFLGNLIAGLKQGFENFGTNILTHLKNGFIGWLTGAMGGIGLQLPDDIFSLEGIFSLVTQVLGITKDYIRAKAVKLLGEKVVGALEGAFKPFVILMNDGPMGLWEHIKDQFTDLKAMVMDQIQDLLITQVIKAGIKWILGLLNPAGAFVKAAMAIYDIVMFFVNQGSQIMELVNTIIDSVRNIAGGAVGGAAQMIENTLGKALPLAIGFLANLLGIGGLAKKVQAIIGKVRKKIDKAVNKFLLKAKKIGRKLLRNLGIGGKDAEDEGEDPRSEKEKKLDLSRALKESNQLFSQSNATPESINSKLPNIKSKYQLTSLILQHDDQNKYYVEGTVNPEDETPKHDLAGGEFSLAPGGFSAHEGDSIFTSSGAEKKIHVLSRHGKQVANVELEDRLNRDKIVGIFRRERAKKIKGWQDGLAKASKQYSKLMDNQEPDQKTNPEKYTKYILKKEDLEHQIDVTITKLSNIDHIRENDRDAVRMFLEKEVGRKNLVFESTKFYKQNILEESVMEALKTKSDEINTKFSECQGKQGEQVTVKDKLPSNVRVAGIGFQFNSDMTEIIPIPKLNNVVITLIISDAKKKFYKVLTAYPAP